jgi:FtsH-binding integral membrane protein
MNHESYWAILLQWLFLFAILSLFYFAGLLFGRLAKKHNKKKWAYMLLGILLLFFGVAMGTRLEFLILEYAPQAKIAGVFRLPLGIFLWTTVYFYLRRSLAKSNNE